MNLSTESQTTTDLERTESGVSGHNAVLDNWGRFLSQFPFDWVVTLTLRPYYRRSEVEVHHPAGVDPQGDFHRETTGLEEIKPRILCPAGVKKAHRAIKTFSKCVKRQLPYPHKLDSFWVLQRQPRSRSLHAHGLLFGVGLEDVSRKETEEWCWDHFGKAQVRLYNPNLGARFYAAQHLLHQNAEDYKIILSPSLHRSAGSGEGLQQPPLVKAAQVDIGRRLIIDLGTSPPCVDNSQGGL